MRRGRCLRAAAAAGGRPGHGGAVRPPGAGALLRRPAGPPGGAELRRPGGQPRSERILRRCARSCATNSASVRTSAARWASRRAAATPATRRSSSTCRTTRASTTSSRSLPKSRPAWTWSTPFSKDDVIERVDILAAPAARTLTSTRSAWRSTPCAPRGTPFVDLTESNPTHAGIVYPATCWRRSRRQRALSYDPDPRRPPRPRGRRSPSMRGGARRPSIPRTSCCPRAPARATAGCSSCCAIRATACWCRARAIRCSST